MSDSIVKEVSEEVVLSKQAFMLPMSVSELM